MPAPLHCFGALALEVAEPPARDCLERAEAETLGTHVALDLQRMLPGVDALDLALLGAHFDPTELLRPGWPLHVALAELARLAPGAGERRVIAFAAHEGNMPSAAVAPDTSLRGGPLRLVPFVLQGDADTVQRIALLMEERLLDTGMAGAPTALHAQQGFGGRLEHARYLSLHDLCAMTAMQYEHAGLMHLWPLIEAALLAPDTDEWLEAPSEPLLLLRAGRVHTAVDSSMSRTTQLRLRQLEAVLHAHAIPLRRHEIAPGTDARATLDTM